MEPAHASFSQIVLDSLAQGLSVSIRVQGLSMVPWLRPGQKVSVRPMGTHLPRPGDIVLFVRDHGQLILHRVIARRGESGAEVFWCRGDSEQGPAETVPRGQIRGMVPLSSAQRCLYLLLYRPRRWVNRLATAAGLRWRHD